MSLLPHDARSNGWQPGTEERVVERRFYESGALQWERAGIRGSRPPALPATEVPDDPVWLTVLAWTLGGFGRGIQMLGEAILAVIMFVVGLALGLLALAAAIALGAGLLGVGWWIGNAFGGSQGGLVGVGVAATVIVLTLVGASDRGQR